MKSVIDGIPEQVVSGPPISVRFVVYGEPVPKSRARTVTNINKYGKRSTHSYTPESTEIQEQKIALVYKSTYHSFRFPEDVPLRLYCDFYFSLPKTYRKRKVTPEIVAAMLAGEIRPMNKKDTDNCIKTVADAGNGVIYPDDEQIVEVEGRKFYSDKPRTEIFVARIDDEK